MTSASSGEATRSEELDTILQFAEESSIRELFAKETELTQTWLSEAPPGEVPSTNSNDRAYVTHTSVEVTDPTNKRQNLQNDHQTTNEDSNKSDNVNDVEIIQERQEGKEMQRIGRNNISDVTSRTAMSSTSTDDDKRSPTDTGTSGGASTSCKGDGGRKNNDPVVAKVRRRRIGGSCSACKCSYFCRLTGIMKLIEMIAMLLALIVTVAVDGACYYSDSLVIVNGVLLMGLTVTPTLLVCYLLKQMHIQETLFEVLINGFLALYSIVAGCSVLGCALSSSEDMAVGVVQGLFFLVAGVAYFVDCVLAILKYKD